MREAIDWTVRAAEQPRPCPACRCWTRPERVVNGKGFVRAEFGCWGCRTRYHHDYDRQTWDDPGNRSKIPGAQSGARRG